MAILFLGDLFYDYDYITQDILEISDYIKKNNYSVVLNLEGAITDYSNSKIKITNRIKNKLIIIFFIWLYDMRM